MPPVNQAALASAGIIAVSVAIAAGIAVYESPEIRRLAQDLRRRIAIALHSIGDTVDPSRDPEQPRFNRPEDAEGFLRSRGQDNGVDADEESRRRQREELMYWNAMREKKRQAEASGDPEKRSSAGPRSTTFDDFLEPVETSEKGTYVFNTGSQIRANADEGVLRHRGVQGLSASVYANPFSDENGIDMDEHSGTMAQSQPNLLSPMTDIYSATTQEPAESKANTGTAPTLRSLSPRPTDEVLFDFNETDPQAGSFATAPALPSSSSCTLERELADDEFVTAGQEADSDGDDRRDAYASIQAWAQNSSSNPGFYSPLPVTPTAPMSEPEVIGDGQLTPTDSVSVIESGSVADVGREEEEEEDDDHGVVSEGESGMATPSSWSEVGSVVSENEGHLVHA